MSKQYEPSKQFNIRLMVYLNEHLLAHNTTYHLYHGENRLNRIRMAKRINRIKKGSTDIVRFMFN